MNHGAVTAAIVASVALALVACGSVHRPERSSPPTNFDAATVHGHVSWPDCRSPASTCPPVHGVEIHFADAAANRTVTATSDDSGSYSIQLPPGSYVAIAGNADRSPFQRPITVQRGDDITLDLSIALPTGVAA